jgi:hypothetical protein
MTESSTDSRALKDVKRQGGHQKEDVGKEPTEIRKLTLCPSASSCAKNECQMYGEENTRLNLNTSK